jgi:ABC-type bacteriocin/lantibiotic exporter with double-glycine peptidase domain
LNSPVAIISTLPNAPKPFRRLTQLLWEDKKDLGLLLVYALLNGVLTLILPVASQALINIIASGVFLQPLIVLSLLVFAGLLFAGLIRIIEMNLLEILQQRLFVNISLFLGGHLPTIDTSQWVLSYPPELVNRFFDVMTIQKSIAKSIITFPAALIQIVISLFFMGFYSSYFLMFNIFILVAFALFVFFGKNAVETNLVESKYKYKMAHMLQDIARCHIAFKVNMGLNYSLNKVDDLCQHYVEARRKHFDIVIRQATWSYVMNAVGTAGLLTMGGWLVMQQEISLGQLVAAELMMLLMIAAANKIVTNIESWYDLLTGLDKLGFLTDLPSENYKGVDYIRQKNGVELVLYNLAFKYPQQQRPVFQDLSMRFSKGTHTAIIGPNGCGKTTLTELLFGILKPDSGRIQVNQQQLSDINIESFRACASLVESPNSIFFGSIRDNIVMGRKSVTEENLKMALEVSGLDAVVKTLPNGLNMILESEGLNISAGKRQMLMLARAIASRPELLVLDEAFHHIDAPTRRAILDRITSKEFSWTLIVITHDPEVLSRCAYTYVLFDGEIVTKGKPNDLAKQNDMVFQSLFPNFVIGDSNQ